MALAQHKTDLEDIPGAALVVRREDISFWSPAADVVRIEIAVSNHGTERSDATGMRIEAAPLGAFVAWSPLTTTTLPPIQPGGVWVATVDVPRDGLPSRPDFERARGSYGLRGFDAPRTLQGGSGIPPDGDVPGRNAPLAESSGRTGTTTSEGRHTYRRRRYRPRSILAQPGDENTYWVGNLNVFIGDTPVERHLARAVRIHPGKLNEAWFFVGERPDAFAFDVEAPADWRVTLVSSRGVPVSTGWVRQNAPSVYVLGMEVPAHAEQGNVNVHVCQQSTGRATIVEFSLDANAAGPGCYVAA